MTEFICIVAFCTPICATAAWVSYWLEQHPLPASRIDDGEDA